MRPGRSTGARTAGGSPDARDHRTLIVLGAGASLDYGAPSTFALTRKLEGRILADDWMVSCGGDRAWTEIRRVLGDYLEGGCEAVNLSRYTTAPTSCSMSSIRHRAP